ncbi:class I SAM-dependent methyltransferase [Saccharopolyspora spinosa]|uniref:class I SAM-dependent methyltransferase n=1 Tax=Saccharopolyspora spinosa TaxID=60894 RepID=UPI003B848A24
MGGPALVHRTLRAPLLPIPGCPGASVGNRNRWLSRTELGGASLRMWQRYFRRGLVYGLDIFEKAGNEGHRVRKLRGDQSDAEFLEDMAGKIGPFDIVIDDGSHVNDHVKKSFQSLFPHVRPGGLYVIEDLQTAYWPGYGGRDGEPAAQRTSIDMLKELIDGLCPARRSDAADHCKSCW